MVLNIDLELEDMIFSEKTSSNSYGSKRSKLVSSQQQ